MSRQDISPELMSLVKSYLKRKTPIVWIDWLPLAEIANNAPVQWIAAFNALDSTDTRGELLELLGLPDSGPLADTLLILLARHALQVEDEQIRDYVIEHVGQAIERTVTRIKALEDVCEPLKDHAAWVAERLKKGFDVAQEITRLELQLAELRAEEHGKADEYDQIHALEREIVKLETYRRSFAGYDFAERNRYKDDLVAETGRLREQKEVMQRVIAEQMEQRDKDRRAVSELQAEHDNLQTEKESNSARSAEVSGAVEQMKRTVIATKAEIERLRLENAGLLGEVERLEQSKREARIRVDQARSKLDELRRDAEQAGYIQVEAKIRDVYDMLPADQADNACR